MGTLVKFIEYEDQLLKLTETGSIHCEWGSRPLNVGTYQFHLLEIGIVSIDRGLISLPFEGNKSHLH
jgi:hypothetical protein